MSVAARPLPALEGTYAQALPELCVRWTAAPVPEPELLALNAPLAAELGLDAEMLHTPEGIAALLGAGVLEGATPVAQAYAGHQFGGYSPRLGDGRALLLGEVVDAAGRRRDLHLKGSGRTPFARGGDGKAAVGPMLREYVVSEAMHALGIPTTRALAVVATGEDVVRETLLPGAVLVRVAASHIRVGTFQYATTLEDPDVVRRLADYAIARHHPEAAEAENPYLALLRRVVDVQARLVARWMLVGFIHGVMNTDNMSISGETIDYGPCAFMEAFDPATVFSSIDHGGRYAYGNQPAVAQWNLARLAEALLGLIDSDPDTAVARATEVLVGFGEDYTRAWNNGLWAKLGLAADGVAPADETLGEDLLGLMQAGAVDLTSGFRALSQTLTAGASSAHGLFADTPAFDAWHARWRAELSAGGADLAATAAAMDRINPIYIPRNHLVEDGLTAATVGDLTPLRALLDALAQPFDARPGLEPYASPAPQGFGDLYQTFCGT